MCACAGSVFAHAFLDRATPAAGSTVRTPLKVTLRFSQRLESAFSTVQVLDADGKRIDKDDAALGGGDASVLSVSLPPVTPGRYTVKWRVLSVDTHVTEGDFTFTVVDR